MAMASSIDSNPMIGVTGPNVSSIMTPMSDDTPLRNDLAFEGGESQRLCVQPRRNVGKLGCAPLDAQCLFGT
jgi:hypothetical protein